MKSIFIGTASTAAIALLSWATLSPHRIAIADEPGENLLKNASMDEVSKDDPLLPANWEKGDDIDGVKYFWNASKEDNKIGYLEISKTAKRYFPIAAWEQTFDHDSSAPAIKVTAKVKTVKVTKAIVDAVFLDENGDPLQHEWLIYIGPKKEGGTPFTHSWKQYSGTVAIPPECKKIKIALQDYGPGNVAFDDVIAVYEKDKSKVKDAVSFNDPNSNLEDDIQTTLNAGNEVPTNANAANDTPPSAQVPSSEPIANSERFADIDRKAPAYTQGYNQSLPSSQPGTTDRPTEPMVANNPVNSLNGFSKPPASVSLPSGTYTRNPAIAQQQAYDQAPISQSSNFSSRQSIEPSPFAQPNQQQAYVQQGYIQPGYQGVAPAPALNAYSSSIALPAPGAAYLTPPGVEVDQVISQMAPVTQERFVNGQRIATTSFEEVYRTSDSRQFSNKEAAAMHASTLKLTKQYHNEADPVAKVQIREDLVGAVTTEYDQMRGERLKEIEELTKKLEEVKANLDKRDKVKDKIIEKRVEQLLGVDQIYQWDSNSQLNSANTPTHPSTFTSPAYQPVGPATTQRTPYTPPYIPNTAPAR